MENRIDLVEKALKYMKKDFEFWYSIILRDNRKFRLNGMEGNHHYWIDLRLEKR